MTLRTAAIEAMARAHFATEWKHIDWADYPEDHAGYFAVAAAALDAFREHEGEGNG